MVRKRREQRKARKTRVPIAERLKDRVLFEADRTCCVCRQRGRSLQIHHIDDDPSNNDAGNLAVLCLECHSETQVHGGFSRGLTAGQVRLFRDNWKHIVAARFKAIPPSGGGGASFRGFASAGPYSPEHRDLLSEDGLALVQKLDALKREAFRLWREAAPRGSDAEALSRANDYTFKVCKDIFFIQQKWFAVNGRYFQGKETMPAPPDYSEGGQIELGVGLTDQVDDWYTVGYADEHAPVQLRCDVYEAPTGHGYVLTIRTRIGDVIWRFQMHCGPEGDRFDGNLRWMAEPRPAL